jgi:hypothetical protein
VQHHESAGEAPVPDATAPIVDVTPVAEGTPPPNQP